MMGIGLGKTSISTEEDIAQGFYVQVLKFLYVFMILSFLGLTAGGQTAFYGRYSTTKLGPTVNGRLDWYVSTESSCLDIFPLNLESATFRDTVYPLFQ